VAGALREADTHADRVYVDPGCNPLMS